jgi:hypothetical protein
MMGTVIPIHVPAPLLQDLEQEAGRAGVSVERWLLNLAADRIRDKIVTERFFSRSPQSSDGQSLLDILNSTHDHPPLPGDEL